MIVAMLDAALTRALPAVVWAAVLVATAMSFAAVRRSRGRRTARGLDAMTLHTTVGMIAMAALQLAMTPAGDGAVSAGHVHGAGGGGFALLLCVGAIAYAVASIVMLSRAHGALDRIQYAAMGASIGVMGVAALL